MRLAYNKRPAGRTLAKMIFAILMIGAVLAAVFIWWQNRGAATPEWVMVERRAMGDIFEERGWLEASQVTPVTLGAGGEIREMAQDGIRVNPGKLLIRVDTTALQERLEQQDEDVSLSISRQEVNQYRRSRTEREAQQNIVVTRDRLKLADMEYGEIRTGLQPEDRRTLQIAAEIRTIEREDADEAYVRQSNLVARALASPITLEDYERRLAAAVAAEEEAKIEYAVRTAPPREDEVLEWKLAVERLQGELERGERALERRLARADAEIDEQEARVAEQQLQFDMTKEELDACDVYAPTGGIFRARYFWEGATRLWQPIRAGVSRGRLDRVGDILQPGAMRVVTMVHEADIAKISVGMPARVRIPALDNLVLTGRVHALGGVGRDRAEVGPTGVEENLSGVTVFNATLTLDHTDERLRPGMSAAIAIECLPVAERLILPREAVGEYHLGEATGKVRLDDGDTRGIKGRYLGGNWFWVEDGLREGERVRRDYAH